jgi:hypothetical protein
VVRLKKEVQFSSASDCFLNSFQFAFILGTVESPLPSSEHLLE